MDQDTMLNELRNMGFGDVRVGGTASMGHSSMVRSGIVIEVPRWDDDILADRWHLYRATVVRAGEHAQGMIRESRPGHLFVQLERI